MFSAFLASLRQEKQKIGAMHRAQAARYLFDYYKLPAIVLLCALLLTVYFAAALLRPRENPDLQVLFVNCYDNVSQDSELMRAFRAYQDARGLNLSARFDANVFFNLSRTADYASAYFQKAVAQLEGGETDAIVCTRENLLGIAWPCLPLYILFLLLTCAWALTTLFLFPVIACFDNTLKQLVLQAFFFAAGKPHISLLLALTAALPVGLTLWSAAVFWSVLIVWVFMGFGLIAWLHSLLLARVFAPYLPQIETDDPQEDEPVAP